jgi:DNA-binding SARP family transcriptional activator
LVTARTALDPGRRLSAGHFITADRYAVSLRRERVAVDVEQFLAAAHEGLAHYRAGRFADARRPLEAADGMYGGDFLEEDLYEDWAASPREEARAAYVSVAGALAELAGADGDHDAATRHRLEVIERDPFDEAAHLALVGLLLGARRHGAARRAYARYAAWMKQIGVEPAAFPASRAVRPVTLSRPAAR